MVAINQNQTKMGVINQNGTQMVAISQNEEMVVQKKKRKACGLKGKSLCQTWMCSTLIWCWMKNPELDLTTLALDVKFCLYPHPLNQV